VDLSRRDFPIAVVKMVIPGVEGPHDHAAYQPGPRAQQLRR
jgi:ribosomal protein S12 methylthiotransferase accessory factor